MVTVSHITKPEQLKTQVTFCIVIKFMSFYPQWNQTNPFWRLWKTAKHVSNLWQNQGRFHCSERRVALASESQSEWQTLLRGLTNRCKIPADSSSLPSKVSSSCSLRLGKPKELGSPYLWQIVFHAHRCPSLKNRLQVSNRLPVKIERVITFLCCSFLICFFSYTSLISDQFILQILKHLQLP